MQNWMSFKEINLIRQTQHHQVDQRLLWQNKVFKMQS